MLYETTGTNVCNAKAGTKIDSYLPKSQLFDMHRNDANIEENTCGHCLLNMAKETEE